MNDFISFRQLMIDTQKNSNEENVRTILEINLAKFDKINKLINSIADLNDANFVQDESKLEQVLCILLKLFEISDDGLPKIKMKHVDEITEDKLLNNTIEELELMESKLVFLKLIILITNILKILAAMKKSEIFFQI